MMPLVPKTIAFLFSLVFDPFACINTRGNFTIKQRICGKNRIHREIDWATARMHPFVREIFRVYVYASPSCANGKMDIPDFPEYGRTYWTGRKRNFYDLETMVQMFFYFPAVCDFYGQYEGSLYRKKAIYLHQAKQSSILLRWFDAHVEELQKSIPGGCN